MCDKHKKHKKMQDLLQKLVVWDTMPIPERPNAALRDIIEEARELLEDPPGVSEEPLSKALS